MARDVSTIQLLGAIARLTDGRGYPPTLVELGEAIGVQSKGALFDRLTRLQEQGLVTRDFGLSRSTVLTEAGRRVLSESSALAVAS